MKPIHECAVIKDGNKRVGYLIMESSDATPNPIAKPWKYVSSSEFEQLVANNKVQYLVWENNTIKCRYNLEEIKAFKRKGMSKYITPESMADYFDMDLSFKVRHIEATTTHNAIACSVVDVYKMLGMYVLPMYMYGDIKNIIDMLSNLSIVLQQDLKGLFKHNGVNVCQANIPYNIFKAMVDSVSNVTPVLFNTSTLAYMIRTEQKIPTIPLLQSRVRGEEKIKILNELHRHTLDTEKRIGI